jgi:hypothetical protein
MRRKRSSNHPVAARLRAVRERRGEAPLHVDIAVEIRFEKTDVAVERGAPARPRLAENDAERWWQL